MKHYSNISSHHFFWGFIIIFFHTLSLGQNTSLIKSTRIKYWLLSVKGLNLEQNFDLLTS